MGLFHLFRKQRRQKENKEQFPKKDKSEQSTLETAINKYRIDCNFTVEQQREWLNILSKTIPTIMLGENPLCVDYALTPRMREEAGSMLNTVGRIGADVGKILSITNMEKALNTDSAVDLIRTYCILDTYAQMLKDPFRSQINTGKMYIYNILLKTDLSKLPEDTPENKLYWAPAIYDWDPLVLESPDYDIHVFPGAANLLQEGKKIPNNGPLPAEYGFATKANGKTMHLRTIRNAASGIEMIPLFTDINMLLRIFTAHTRVSIVDYRTACRFCLQDKHICSGIIINPGVDNRIIPTSQISDLNIPAVSAQPQPTPPEKPAAAHPTPEPADKQPKDRYTYRVSSISKTDPWVFIECNEEDATWDAEPFTELVKKAAGIMNDGVWNGNIIPAGIVAGDTRYRIKNDPLLMVFQYDTLFGIVLEYTPSIGLEGALNYLSNMLGVEVDDKFRQ